MLRHRGRKNTKKIKFEEVFFSFPKSDKNKFMTVGLLEKKLQGGGSKSAPHPCPITV